jgi:hypothetical protein
LKLQENETAALEQTSVFFFFFFFVTRRKTQKTKSDDHSVPGVQRGGGRPGDTHVDTTPTENATSTHTTTVERNG